MAARMLRTVALTLTMSLVLVPTAFAFPEEPIEETFESIVDFLESIVGGGGGYDNVDNEVLEWEGDGGGSGGGEEEPQTEAR
jgi:hypothetical protein